MAAYRFLIPMQRCSGEGRCRARILLYRDSTSQERCPMAGEESRCGLRQRQLLLQPAQREPVVGVGPRQWMMLAHTGKRLVGAESFEQHQGGATNRGRAVEAGVTVD